jgi:hypothetical protein
MAKPDDVSVVMEDGVFLGYDDLLLGVYSV